MVQRTRSRSLALGWISLIVGLAPSAQAQYDRGTGTENTEILIGSYYCGVAFDPPDAFAWYSFEGSGDIFLGNNSARYVYRRYGSGSTAPDFCDPIASASSGTLQRLGCSVGAIESRSDEYGSVREFRFVCHARRSRIIALIAEISEQHLTASP